MTNKPLFRILFLIFLSWTIVGGTVDGDCPGVSPCSCEKVNSGSSPQIRVTCRSLGNVTQLFRSARALSGLAVDSFLVFDSNVGGRLPSNLFELDSRVTSVQIYDTPIAHFTEARESAFFGLRHALRELVLRRCHVTDDFKVERLEELSVLSQLDLSYNDLSRVQAEWFNPKHPRKLASVALKGNSISDIAPGAFASLTLLKLIDLSENRLSAIDRSSLPSPAEHLEFIYLSDNQLDHLPDNFFVGMPILKKVYLDNNRLSVMRSSLLEHLWKTNANILSHFDLLGNDLICDVRLCWMAFYDNDYVTGSCAEPDQLRGRRLRSLWPWDLDCDEKLYKGDTHIQPKPKM